MKSRPGLEMKLGTASIPERDKSIGNGHSTVQ
jgi:hypothetical protein